MGRYKSIFKIERPEDRPSPSTVIKDREEDLYITYNAADRLDLISSRIYGDPQYWWIILAANGYEIEFEIEEGEILRIPYPLTDAIKDIKDNL